MFVQTQPAGNHLDRDLPPDPVLFGNSKAMQELRHRVARICPTGVSVLLQGEVGVGKSVLSRFIHCHSTGLVGPYVRVNCAALSGPSGEGDQPTVSEEGKGATFDRVQEGIATSSIGTLFLDQVSELTSQFQHQLSVSVADCVECESGNQANGRGTVRIICASTRNLRQEVKRGRFRQDLFHRLAVVTIDVPPLRKRPEDLATIAEYLRDRYSVQLGTATSPFPRDLLARMLRYPWPGNICELENFVCRFVVLGGGHCSFPAERGATECGLDFDRDDRVAGKLKQNWQH